MTGRLVVDAIRRIPIWPTWFFLALFAAAWMVFGFSGSASYGIAASLGMAYGIGPFWLPRRGETPVIPYLPVSRGDIWRANWILSTVVAVAAVTALELPAALASAAFGGSALGFSSLTLTVVINFLYTGSGCALVAASGLAGTRHRLPGPLGGLWLWTTFVLFVGGIAWGFAVHRALPTRWAEVTATHVAVMAVGAILTLASYFHQPWFGARPVKLGTARAARPSTRPVRPGAMSALPRLFAHELAWSAGMGAAMAVTFSIIAIVIDGVSGSFKSPIEVLASQRLLIFGPEAAPSAFERPDFFTRFGWYSLFMACVSVRFPEMIRHLRALPLGGPLLEALLIGWPVLIWTLVWVLLAGIQLAVAGPGSMTTTRLPLLLTMIGMSALVQALGLRFEKWKSYAGAMLAVPFAWLVVSQSSWWLLVVGVLTTAGAMALNRASLRRADTYKRAVPFGMKTQDA